MNREIKFRAWDKKSKQMFNIDVLAISPCTWDCPDYNTRGVSLAYQPSIPVMRYTGLKDKNDKEIYEGDIVENIEQQCMGKIAWNGDEAGFYFYMLMTDGGYIEEPIYEFIEDMRVIGNIYNNPELLESNQ